MIKNEYVKQTEFEVVTIEQLVPQNHVLRKVEKHYDFSFVRTRMEGLYCKDNGRPAVDPVMLFKMLFIGYMFGIRSERQLVKEIEVNVAYRWFLNMTLTDKVPHHSTISQNRIRRFDGTDVFRQLFNDVVFMACDKGFIEGRVLYTDSTHLKANANKKKFTRVIVEVNTKSYIDELIQAVNEDREKHGKKPFKPLDKAEPETKENKVSRTDPDSGYFARPDKPEGFHYLDHRTCDDKHNLITDVYVTPGNVSDNTVYLERLEHQIDNFDFAVEIVGLDSGYSTQHIAKTLIDKNIDPVISYRKPGGAKGLFRRSKFSYNPETDTYTCPGGQVLPYSTTNRLGFKTYCSDPTICSKCPKLSSCTTSKAHRKIIERHVWEVYQERAKSYRESELGIHIKRRRSETIERSFADAKQLHSYRYARFRGLKRVEAQCLMTAMVQNIKKMVNILEKRDKTGGDDDKRRKTLRSRIRFAVFEIMNRVLQVKFIDIRISTHFLLDY
jgi:transposase